MSTPEEKQPSRIQRLADKAMRLWTYVSSGLWSDPRRTWWLKLLRTVNLSVQSFLSRDVQTQACAMTYRTMLAVVPALALLLAIGRGFGFQEVLQDELYALFPAQRVAIGYSLNFVDSYLNQASEGVFVGVGILFLLYTLINLISSVENTFNKIWGQSQGRGIWRKFSDYTSMLLILPVLMICAGGLNLLLSKTLDSVFHFSFMTPVVTAILEGASWLMIWLFFTAIYVFIPNARVRFANAFVSGVIAGTGFMVLQWLFVTGTLYVTKYNAIYGSFAFLPLLLLWLQLVWVMILAGAVICYSSQNVFAFNLQNEVGAMSSNFRSKVTLAVAALMVQRFERDDPPATARYLMEAYDLPAQLVNDVLDKLVRVGVLNMVVIPPHKDMVGYQLALDPDKLTVGSLFARLYGLGASEFIPNFSENFPGPEEEFNRLNAQLSEVSSGMKLSEMKVNLDKPTINSEK